MTTGGQVVNSAECFSPGQRSALTVHNFSRGMTDDNLAALAERRAAGLTAFLGEVQAQAPGVCGYIEPANATADADDEPP